MEAQLAAAGLLIPKEDDPDIPSGVAARTLEVEVDAWLQSESTRIELSEAILEDRSGR